MHRLNYKDFIAPYRTTEYENVRENLSYSDHGYYITPEGRVYSLDEAMSHGRVVAAIYPELFNELVKENPNLYCNGISTEIDLVAVSRYNWFRISIVAAIGDLNFSWGSAVTPQQITAMEVIIDSHDPEKEMEYWYDGGPGSLREMKAKIRETNACTL